MGLQELCAANYLAVVRLLPQLQGDFGGRFVIDAVGGGEVNVRVLERGPYTTSIDIEQAGEPAAAGPAHFQVRVYHDARMAEVIACQGHRQIKPRYDYPNAAMYQRDEKFQVNRFFGEWLSSCLPSGRSVSSIGALLD